MSNRVFLNSNQMRISRPGYDAVNSDDRFMLLDTNWHSLGVIATGLAYVPALSTAGFYWGFTLPYVPFCIIQIEGQPNAWVGNGPAPVNIQDINGNIIYHADGDGCSWLSYSDHIIISSNMSSDRYARVTAFYTQGGSIS